MKEKFFILDALGGPVKVTIRRSIKAKNINIRITRKVTELVIPCQMHSDHGYNFLLSKESWIRKKLPPALPKQVLNNENQIPILGKFYRIIYYNSPRHTIKLNGDIIELSSTDLVRKKLLQFFLQKKIFTEITEIASLISKKYKLSYTNLRIMENATKWGSCSNKRVIAVHWRIVFAPYEVLKYLVVHEMCHLKEMNHSKNFWQLVATIYPEYLSAKIWLKNNGRTLYNYLN